jgi:hypothetical protein
MVKDRRIAKNLHIPKKTGLSREPDAWKIYLKSVDEFRRRRKFHTFIRIKPFISYLSVSKRKKDFLDFCEELEKFRFQVLGMNIHRFYKLVVEFVLSPDNRRYYNPMHLFGCEGSYEADEFRHRTFEVLVLINSSVGDANESSVLEFIEKVGGLNNRVDLKGIDYKSKDWYCVEAVLRIIKDKNWSVDEAIGKIKTFYRNRIRKIYAEALLRDFSSGEFDSIQFNEYEKKGRKSKPRHISAIEKQPWFKSWAEGLKKYD